MAILLVITIFLVCWKLGNMISRYWAEKKERTVSFEEELEGK